MDESSRMVGSPPSEPQPAVGITPSKREWPTQERLDAFDAAEYAGMKDYNRSISAVRAFNFI